jgi:propanediol dehydratase large subunit
MGVVDGVGMGVRGNQNGGVDGVGVKVRGNQKGWMG